MSNLLLRSKFPRLASFAAASNCALIPLWDLLIYPTMYMHKHMVREQTEYQDLPSRQTELIVKQTDCYLLWFPFQIKFGEFNELLMHLT